MVQTELRASRRDAEASLLSMTNLPAIRSDSHPEEAAKRPSRRTQALAAVLALATLAACDQAPTPQPLPIPTPARPAV